ncbi:MAG: hypothetical protein KKA55_03070 [Proteobacteria bacterium]|nr:hypothetical protein [Pseudomonadota bacterium]MBU1594499.1 hypothetical protein [Pseudomonadota bacterium]
MRTRLPAAARRPGRVLPALALLGLAALSLGPEARAGQIRESDLHISSTIGKVVTTAEGDKVDARSSVHSVDIKRGSSTGEVHITGQAGRVTTQAGGQNTSAASTVGGVKVGDNK